MNKGLYFVLVYCAIHWCTNYARSVMCLTVNLDPFTGVHTGSIILHACVMFCPYPTPYFQKVFGVLGGCFGSAWNLLKEEFQLWDSLTHNPTD